ncbi:hypothetical protein PGT21_026799 [Puccinia graminis f. sp. tritici]|uniref:Uncharacterized protein n=1 Tax=Puccinia graminis f. sp. tritici TaxID=56615 RepID=A0A5B0N3Z0_PUCGR|nr:hypothetical protein PGT21_026799 [Puccinia graminis f. sp. tritici]
MSSRDDQEHLQRNNAPRLRNKAAQPSNININITSKPHTQAHQSLGAPAHPSEKLTHASPLSQHHHFIIPLIIQTRPTEQPPGLPNPNSTIDSHLPPHQSSHPTPLDQKTKIECTPQVVSLLLPIKADHPIRLDDEEEGAEDYQVRARVEEEEGEDDEEKESDQELYVVTDDGRKKTLSAESHEENKVEQRRVTHKEFRRLKHDHQLLLGDDRWDSESIISSSDSLDSEPNHLSTPSQQRELTTTTTTAQEYPTASMSTPSCPPQTISSSQIPITRSFTIEFGSNELDPKHLTQSIINSIEQHLDQNFANPLDSSCLEGLSDQLLDPLGFQAINRTQIGSCGKPASVRSRWERPVETIRSAESLTDEGRTIFNELDPNAPFHESSNSALSHPSTLISDSHKSNSYLKLNQHGNLSAAADSLLSATQDLHHSPELVDYDALTLDRELSLKIKQTQEHLEASLKALKDLLIKTGSIGSGGNERSLSVNSSFTRPELNDRNHTQPQTQPTHQNRPIGSSQSSVITNASQMKSKPRVKLTQPATTISYLSSSTAAICHQRSPSRPNSNPK